MAGLWVDGHPANDFLVSAPRLARIRATPESSDSDCSNYTDSPGYVKEERTSIGPRVGAIRRRSWRSRGESHLPGESDLCHRLSILSLARVWKNADDEGIALTPGPSPNFGRGERLRSDAVVSSCLRCSSGTVCPRHGATASGVSYSTPSLWRNLTAWPGGV